MDAVITGIEVPKPIAAEAAAALPAEAVVARLGAQYRIGDAAGILESILDNGMMVAAMTVPEKNAVAAISRNLDDLLGSVSVTNRRACLR